MMEKGNSMITQEVKQEDIGEGTSGYGAIFTLYLSQRFTNFSSSHTPLEGLGRWLVLDAFLVGFFGGVGVFYLGPSH